MKKNITLIGMPGSGKSTVGVILAKALGYEFLDTDLLIQSQEGKLLCEIIAERGNEGFKQIENQVNASVSCSRTVIAPGGSVVYGREAMEHLKEISTVVYLKLGYEAIVSRIEDTEKRGVVLEKGQTLLGLYEERCLLYEAYADLAVDADQESPGAVMAMVLDAMGKEQH